MLAPGGSEPTILNVLIVRMGTIWNGFRASSNAWGPRFDVNIMTSPDPMHQAFHGHVSLSGRIDTQRGRWTQIMYCATMVLCARVACRAAHPERLRSECT